MTHNPPTNTEAGAVADVASIARASVVRLAELWYHADGFTEMAAGGRLPDPAPWIEAALTEEHSGDCTKHPWSCMRCHAEDQMAVASWVMPRLAVRQHLEQGATAGEAAAAADHTIAAKGAQP